MRINLFHNKIIKDTATEKFVSAVENELVALVSDIYDDATEILMYEDYIADNFEDGGLWYYPLTVKRGEGVSVVWIPRLVRSRRNAYDDLPDVRRDT